MIQPSFQILNQKGTPMFYSDIYANIPTAGVVGRMFISTDTYAFYRDTGSGWDLIGGPGTGTITGTGAAGQVSFFSGASTIGGSNNLFWDSVNNRLGIGTATPGVQLDIHTTGTGLSINGTGTNNSFQTFQNAGTGKWRIGNNYSTGSNYFSIYDVSNSTERLSITNAGVGTFTGNFTATNLFFKTNAESTKISNTVPTGGVGQNVFIGGGGDSVTFTTLDTGGYNTAIGFNALNNVTTGYRNTAIGQVSLRGITTGYQNTALGDNAGRFYGGIAAEITTNINSIFIGRNSQASANGNTNEIVIGVGVVGNGSNSVTIGDGNITKTILTGNLLLGTTTDSGYKLSVVGTTNLNGLLTGTSLTFTGNTNNTFTATSSSTFDLGVQNTGTGNTRIRIGNATSTARATITLGAVGTEFMRIGSEGNFPVYLQTNGTDILTIDGSGNSSFSKNLSINTTTVGTYSKLLVAGGIHFNNNTDGLTSSQASYGNIYAKSASVTGGAGATTIKSGTGSEASLFLISGLNITTNARFTDIVLFLGAGTTTPVVVNSQTSGTPATRTYTNTGENLKLSLTGDTNVYNVYMTTIGANES